MPIPRSQEPDALSRIRRLLLATLAAGLIGTLGPPSRLWSRTTGTIAYEMGHREGHPDRGAALVSLICLPSAGGECRVLNVAFAGP